MKKEKVLHQGAVTHSLNKWLLPSQHPDFIEQFPPTILHFDHFSN